MAQKVEGSLYESLTGQLFEIGRQLRQKNGYPFNPESLHRHLQDAIEGKFVCRWTTDLDGVIRFNLTGLGLTGSEMKKHLVSEGYEVSDRTKQVLNSSDYVPAKRGKVYHLAILPGKIFSDEDRTIKNIRAEGDRRGLIHGENLPTEIGALIRLSLTDEEIKQMDLYWLITMHEAVEDSGGNPYLLSSSRGGGKSWLRAGWDDPGIQWGRADGFVFGVPQVSPQD